jgi:formylglycine-generating enzyme required for sulfatase activity/serine/threonine protein kinase
MSSAADPTAVLYQYLQASGLLTDAQLRELWGWIAHKKPDIKGLAQELARRGWLTAFQIKEVAKNRGAALRVAERYVLLDVLGEGGMGRVYKAHDTRMGRDVALKVIRKEKLKHPAAAGRFLQEMVALGAMTKHPNVVEVFTADQVGDSHYCVMEYIDGADLTRLVREGGPMPVPQACEVVRQAALGLQHAFETGLVHRDIKPSNIIVPRAGGAVKLVDLGLARVIDAPPGEEAGRITQEGFVIGTPDFLAPEQARDPLSVDIRADVYALGGTLFYALTGRPPFDGGTPTEKLLRHCTEAPPHLLDYRPEAPPALQQIIHWCMAKEPGKRPQTPLQLAVALQPFCPPPPVGTGVFAVPPLRTAPPQPAYAPAYAPAPAPLPQPLPLPLPEPNPSSQVFKLPPPDRDDDPIRRRSEGGFPVALVLIPLGALFVLGVLGLAAYRAFLASDPGPPGPFTNTVGLAMVELPGGTFRMGSPESEPGRRPDEGPVREVAVRGPFFMSAAEVTNGQYLRVMGKNPARATGIAKGADHLPVENVTWDEAVEFCRALTEKERGQPWVRKGWAYRLPTEAEWEYACRAGTDSPTAFGERLVFGKQALYRPSEKGEDPTELGGDPARLPKFPQEAGAAEANKFGLRDMHGNVAEWCADWYRSEAYKDAAKENPTGPADGDKRVIRGGSFRDPAGATRSAARSFARPNQRQDSVGFRVVYAPVQK